MNQRSLRHDKGNAKKVSSRGIPDHRIFRLEPRGSGGGDLNHGIHVAILTKQKIQVIAGDLYRRGLTKREVQTCIELFDLPCTAVLAARLGCSEQMAKCHLNSIYRKLSVPSRNLLWGLLESMVKHRITLDGVPLLDWGKANGSIKS